MVLCISLGLFLFTYESTQFNLTGFMMCLAASVISGLRWTLTQKVAQKDELGKAFPSSSAVYLLVSLEDNPQMEKMEKSDNFVK